MNLTDLGRMCKIFVWRRDLYDQKEGHGVFLIGVDHTNTHFVSISVSNGNDVSIRWQCWLESDVGRPFEDTDKNISYAYEKIICCNSQNEWKPCKVQLHMSFDRNTEKPRSPNARARVKMA